MSLGKRLSLQRWLLPWRSPSLPPNKCDVNYLTCPAQWSTYKPAIIATKQWQVMIWQNNLLLMCLYKAPSLSVDGGYVLLFG